jgi:hypothetical protein
MALLSENNQHDLLLVVVSLLFILFTSGLAIETRTPAVPLIVPNV